MTSIRILLRNKTKSKFRSRIILLLALLMIAISFYFLAWNLRQQVLRKVMSHQLKEDSLGIVLLPSFYHFLSVNGQAYVTRSGNLVIVYFPTSINGHMTSEGSFVTNRILRSSDLLDDSSGQRDIEINVPLMPAREQPGDPLVGFGDARIDRQINDTEYEVSISD